MLQLTANFTNIRKVKENSRYNKYVYRDCVYQKIFPGNNLGIKVNVTQDKCLGDGTQIH